MIEHARASIVGDSTTDSLWEKAFSAEPDRRMIRSNINNQTLNPYLEYISMVEHDVWSIQYRKKKLKYKEFQGWGGFWQWLYSGI